MKLLFTLLTFLIVFNVSAQKKEILRSVAQLNYEGFLKMNEGSYKEAIVLFNEALLKDPEAYFIYQNRAITKLNLNDTLGAIEDLRKNFQLEPANAESPYILGNLYKNMNDTVNAKTYFLKSIENANPDLSINKLIVMHSFLGKTDQSCNQFESAISHYDKVLELDSLKTSLYINKAVCYYYLDSLNKVCTNLKIANNKKENVPCWFLQHICNECSTDTNRISSKIENDPIDEHLIILLEKFPLHATMPDTYLPSFQESSFEKFFLNEKWEICMPEKACFYRETFWSPLLNFYYSKFTDYYLSGQKYAEGFYSRRSLEGNFVKYYLNGNIQIIGFFKNGTPSGEWKYFSEDGKLTTSINMFFQEFIPVLMYDPSNNILVQDGNGFFNFQYKTWENKILSIKGALLKNNKTREWKFLIDDELILSEWFDNGEFQKGIYYQKKKKTRTLFSSLHNVIFKPPFLTRLENFPFESEDVIKFYPFIKKQN